LDREDNTAIKVPFGVTKSNPNARTNKQLTALLSGLRFWGVANIPDKVVARIVLKQKFRFMQSVVNQFKVCFPILETVKTLHQYHPHKAMTKALEMKNLEIVHILGNNRGVFPPNACDILAEFGNRQSLELARKGGAQISSDTFLRAAKTGNLEVVKYLHEVGCPCSEALLIAIFVRDHKGCMRYAVANNFFGL